VARGDVQAQTAWTTGLTGPDRNTFGSDRLLVFTAGMEADGDCTITSASYGGQPLTQVVTSVAGSSYMARAYIFYLDEAGLQAAGSDTLSVTWSSNPLEVLYAARIYRNVDQSTPIRDSQQASTESSTPNPITTPALTVENGDYVVAAAQCGNAQTYTWNNSFVVGSDQTAGSCDHSTADLEVTSDGTAVASATNASPNRQVIVGAVLQRSLTVGGNVYYVRPDGNDANAGTGPTVAEAWQTAAQAFCNDVLLPGDTIYIMAGTYDERIRPDEDGIAGNPIRVIADTTGSVSGWPAGDVILQCTWEKVLDFDRDNYFYVHGFQIDAVDSKEGVKIKDSLGVEISNCEIDGAKEGIKVDDAEATIVNCIVRDSVEEGIYVQDASTVTIFNTTVAHNAHDGLEVDGGTVTVTNSIFAYNTDDGIDRDGGTVTHTYNISFGNGSNNFEGVTQDATESTSDPLFADAGGRDYRLSSGSPAIDTGTDAAGTVDDDLDGLSRPIGGGWDIGCYEYDLVGYWAFDDGFGITAADSSGNGHDATLQSGADWVAARCAYATLLDGFDDWVDLGQFSLSPTAYTVTAYFRTEADARQTIVAATDAGTSDQAMFVEVQADGTVRFVHRYPAATSGGTEVVSTETYDDGYWHFVAVTKDTDTMTLYIDGQLIGTTTDTADVEWPLDVVAGTDAKSSGGNNFEGALDEIRLYGSALSADEVGQLYGMIGYWKLDESSGAVADDASVFANDGTVVGAQTWQPDDGRVDGALEFDGSGDRVDVGRLDCSGSAMSIVTWFRADDFDVNDCRIVSKATSSATDDHFWMLSTVQSGSDIRLRARVKTDGSTSTLIAGSGNLSPGDWTHAAVVYDGSDIVLYLNGEEVDRTGKSGTLDEDPAVSVWIGDNPGPDRKLFDGLIDDVRLYDRALCSDEINELYLAGRMGGYRIVTWVEIQ